MTHASVKQRALEAVATLPEDATFEDAMERLYFLAKVEQGLAQADAGELIPHDEVEARFASSANTVDLIWVGSAAPAAGATMAVEHVDGVVRSAGAEATARPEREVTHLALDAARHGAPATGADLLLAELVQNPRPGALSLRVVLRGEWPPGAAACGG